MNSEKPRSLAFELQNHSQIAKKQGKTKIQSASSGKKTKGAAKRKGTLRVIVKPWAKIYLDGKYYDETPFPPVRMKPGKHSIRFVNPDLKKDVKRTFVLKSGQDLKMSESWNE